jgi:hypothetical protein
MIYTEWNQLPNIVNLVIMPKMANIKILNLGANNISSVEPLQTLKMINL